MWNDLEVSDIGQSLRIFSQAESFENKEILNVPWYSKKAKKQKNVENFLLMKKIAKIFNEVQISHFVEILKFFHK